MQPVLRLALLLSLCLACSKGFGDRPCATDGDCPSPQKCTSGLCASSGFCIGSPACNLDANCAPGQHCANGCCVPGESGTCARDADCSSHPATPVCDAARGLCVACLVSRDCGPGKLCTNDVCEALPGCASNRDCLPPTPVCDLQHHACVQCLDSTDCTNLSASICNASHQCVAACAADVDCAKPTPRCLVSSGSCVACLSSADCASPLVCDPVQHVCQQPSATTCTVEKDCASNPSAPHCLPGTSGKPGTCVACIDDTQCASGETCTADHTCVVKQCLGDTDCAAPTPKCLVGATPQVCVACLSNPDCPNGGVCQPDHTCVAPAGCTNCAPPTPACNTVTNTCVACVDDTTCPSGQVCTPQNTCVSNKCTSDSSCTSLPQTPHCDTSTGSCVQCTSDGQCKPGNKCVSDACKPVCTPSTQATDCPAATPICLTTPFPSCVQCVASTDCGANMVCTSSNTCVAQTGCTSSATCPPATPVCVAPNCVQCAVDLDCKNGEGCDTTAHTCTLTGGTGQICGTGGTCSAGLLCIDEGGPNGPVCRPKCNPYVAACASGTVCLWFGFDSNGAFEGYCSAPNGHGALGAACDPTVYNSCEWNLICAPTSATAGLCRAVCDPAATGNCGTNVCNAVVGAVSKAGVQEKFGYCAASSKWGQTCVSDSPSPTGSAGDCGVVVPTGAGTGGALYCSPSYLPAENPQASVLGICSYTPKATTAIGGAGDSCAAHSNDDCRTGVCLSDGPVTCFSGCNPTADCTRDYDATHAVSAPPSSWSNYCFDINFATPYQSNVMASCQPTCNDDTDCAALGAGGLGRSCDPQQTHNGSSWRAACAPVAGGGKPGSTCKAGSDCGSGTCITAATLQGIELGQSLTGFTATDGFCFGSAAYASDCPTAGTVLAIDTALPIRPIDGVQGVMGRPHPGVCWPQENVCQRDPDCVGLSADASTPRVCAPYKTTALSTSESATACTSDAQCTAGPFICNTAANNPAFIYGPNGKCRGSITWALECAPSLGAARLGAGAACVHSPDCRTGHCLQPASVTDCSAGGCYCFGGCSTNGDCLNNTHCSSSSYLGITTNFCQP